MTSDASPLATGTQAAALLPEMCAIDDDLVQAQWSPVSEWASFFAYFVHLQSDSGRDVAVKFGKTWTPEDTEYVASEVARVRRLFASLPSGHVEVPPVLGWSPQPAAIALPFVAGDNLFAALGSSDHPIHDDPGRLTGLMRAAGEALGAYHAAEPAPDDTDEQARQDMLAAARRSGYRSRIVDELEAAIPVVRGYRLSHNDFTIGEPVAGGTGLVILDPPHVRKFDHIHRDMSAFTLALHRALIGERRGSDARHADLRAAVLDGYRATGPDPLDKFLDAWLLRFYELSRIGSQMSGRLRSRRAGPAIRSFRWWLAERRSLGRPPGL